MFIEELPDWFGDAQTKLNKAIEQICVENKIDWAFVNDSKGIEEAKDAILSRLVAISFYSPSIKQQAIKTSEHKEKVLKPHKAQKKKRTRTKFTPEMKMFFIEAYNQNMDMNETAKQMNAAFPELNNTMTGERVRAAWYVLKNKEKNIPQETKTTEIEEDTEESELGDD